MAPILLFVYKKWEILYKMPKFSVIENSWG